MNIQYYKIKIRLVIIKIKLLFRSSYYKFRVFLIKKKLMKYDSRFKGINKTQTLPLNPTVIVNKYAKNSCNKCYGRGYTGRDIKTKKLIPCKCIIKNLRKAVSENKIEIKDNTMLVIEDK